eukprot:475453-Alexandrium_andersonii.AAC.1
MGSKCRLLRPRLACLPAHVLRSSPPVLRPCSSLAPGLGANSGRAFGGILSRTLPPFGASPAAPWAPSGQC